MGSTHGPHPEAPKDEGDVATVAHAGSRPSNTGAASRFEIMLHACCTVFRLDRTHV